jgi:phage shock protein PspC (stress-responsive transcriptional regulator)
MAALGVLGFAAGVLQSTINHLIPSLADTFASGFGATVVIAALAASGAILYSVLESQKKSLLVSSERIERIEEKAAQQPEKSKFAWDLARAKLEAYFDRNLSQVRMIFVVAVCIMVVGFGFVLWGVLLAISNPVSTKTSYVAAISGIITQFIGVTFMVIYRSTMTQANKFMEVLERINTVGMAVQILDAIPEAEAELKNTTRSQIVALLLSLNDKKSSK